MDPAIVGAAQWEAIRQAVVSLVLFVALAINGALAFALGGAILPSLLGTAEAPGQVRVFRRVLYPLLAASVVLALVALARTLTLAASVLQQLYPRFLI